MLKEIPLEKMVEHVGRHILKGEVQSDICGIYRRNACQNKLIVSSVAKKTHRTKLAACY